MLGEQSLEVILGMNWMAKYKGHIDCTHKAVTITSREGKVIRHVSSLSSAEARCTKGTAELTVDQVPVVCEYADVFP